MDNTDKELYDIFNNEEEFYSYINNISYRSKGNHKKYQTIAFDDLGFGFIIENQESIIAIYEDKDKKLSRFIGENDIIIRNKGGKRVESYKFVYIRFYGINNSVYRRSLSKILLLANGVMVENHNEGHHDLHVKINTKAAVLYISKRENASRKPKFSTDEQAFEYIRTDIIKTDDIGFQILIDNIIFIAKRYENHRGIYVSGVNPTENINETIAKYKVSLSGL